MAPMTPRTETHRVVDLSLPGGSTLRVGRRPGEGGEAGVLLLAHGFGAGDAFRRPPWTDALIQIPDSALPELIEALEALQSLVTNEETT